MFLRPPRPPSSLLLMAEGVFIRLDLVEEKIEEKTEEKKGIGWDGLGCGMLGWIRNRFGLDWRFEKKKKGHGCGL